MLATSLVMRSDSSFVQRLLELGVATIDEATKRKAYLADVHLMVGEPFAGRAITVAVPAGDNLGIHLAVAQATAGSVVCVASAGRGLYGVVGDLLLEAARVKRIAGFVLDDGIRDSAQLVAPPSIAARTVTARGTAKRRLRQQVGAGIAVGNVYIASGDWIVCDPDGVCVVPGANVSEVLEIGESRLASEVQVRARLAEGIPSLSALNLPETAAASLGP
jgi:4-hydroxy-4-methyl-2-oxoglutarate aldolase